MRRIWIGTLALALSAALGCAGHSPIPGAPTQPTLKAIPGSAKLLEGPRNTRVELVELDPETGIHSLIRVTGTRTEIDGRALPYEFSEWSDSVHGYSTLVHGYSRSFVRISRPNRSTEGEFFELKIPGKREAYRLKETNEKPLDVTALLLDYERAVYDGSLDAFATFDRLRQIQLNEDYLKEELDSILEESCGFSAPLTIAWDSFSDQEMLRSEYWVSGYCRIVPETIESFCRRSPLTGSKLAAILESFQCTYGEQAGVRLDGKALVSSVHWDASDLQENTRDLIRGLSIPSEPAPVGALERYEAARMCRAENGQLVGYWPTPDGRSAVLYGNKDALVQTENTMRMSDGQFFDPREEQTGGQVFRGIDYRWVSAVNHNDEQNTCELRCGNRIIPLSPLAGEERFELLSTANVKQSPRTRVAYALARDRTKRYFYVDTGLEKGSLDFRVYSGSRGRLEQLKMTNVVNDSEGIVFTTREGTLRLVIEEKESFWTEGNRTSKLVNVPIEENLNLVYSGLGVYMGQPFGTPCDSL